MVSIDINISLLWQILNFFLLVLILNTILFRPIRGILKERSIKMAQLNTDIITNSTKIKFHAKKIEEYQIDFRKQGMALFERLKNEARAKEREILSTATKDIESSINKVRNQIASEVAKAREELKLQTQNFGVNLVQKILGRSIK